MEKLTVIIPTYNEQHNIEALLKQVDFADEILVIDSFSTDNTIELAKKFNVTILQRTFDNYSVQKNYAIERAKHSWIFLIDADERISEALKQEVLETINREKNVCAFWIYRANYFMGRKLHFSGVRHDKVIRLFRRDDCRYNGKLVHEEITTLGKVGFLKQKFEHYTYKDFNSYKKKIVLYAKAQSIEYDKKVTFLSPYHFVIKPGFRFIRSYIIAGGFLDGFPGFVYSWCQMYAVFLRYSMIWELRTQRKQERVIN